MPARPRDSQAALVEAAHSAHGNIFGADGVGVTMLLASGIRYGCTNAFSETIDGAQYRLMQGPCVAAGTSGLVVRSETVDSTEQRWPSFAAEAAAVALQSVVSVPLITAGRVIGTLNVYSRTRGALAQFDDDAAEQAALRVAPMVRNTRLLAIADHNFTVMVGDGARRRTSASS